MKLNELLSELDLKKDRPEMTISEKNNAIYDVLQILYDIEDNVNNKKLTGVIDRLQEVTLKESEVL